jgi:hypothetical protein
MRLDNSGKILYNNSMYKVISKNHLTLNDCSSLDEAMLFAKTVGAFVTIKGPEFEVCGMFGVDSVKNGVCPDGVAYDWNKASRIGGMKRERIVEDLDEEL